ncbi:diguanylate cyclase [Bacillus sp. FJAT-49732]|uniref:Diguanylate cyclase n=1 Tax=Lederbergia citrisecunda TaxID=2833583 RepID=A0A942TRL3_9BACI|nr:diguanylate cyclase [Lederbergia citrisecunda]MBS4201601.1 diguanylate cyclase [Lederbergia citrisecunda]
MNKVFEWSWATMMMVDKNPNSVKDIEVLDLVWNNTTDAIFTIGHDGAIINANPAFEELFGWSVSEIIGLSFPPFFSHITKAEHQEFLQKLREGRNFPYVVSKRKHKDGSVLDIIASYRSINNQDIIAVGMYKNFTEQMKIQRLLQTSEDTYRTLVESLTEAIIVQRHGKIIFLNSAGVKLFGQKRLEDIIGKSIWDFVSSKQKETFEKMFIRVLGQNNMDKALSISGEFIRYDGKLICAEIKVIAIKYQGESSLQILIQDISEKRNYEAQLEYLAYHDPLTGLKNRRKFTTIVEESIKEAEMTDEKIAIMYIDLDNFKAINDSLGHNVGDELLQQFANRLKSSLRKNDELCRVGGDEFLVLLKNITDNEQIEKAAMRMQSIFNAPYTINNVTFDVSSSIGISVYPEHGTLVRYLISHADQALYKAKENKNKYVFYS